MISYTQQALFLAVYLLFMPSSHGFQIFDHEPSTRVQLGRHKNLSPSQSYEQSVITRSTTTMSINLFPEATTDLADPTSTLTTAALSVNTDLLVFLAGVFPFAWATVEFWRRVIVGESFGTGTDSVIIGMDDSPADSRGRRVLGKGALVAAIVLFTISFGTIGIVLYSVVTSGTAPDVLPEVTAPIIEDCFVFL